MFTVAETGRTVTEEWARAGAGLRSQMLNMMGRWTPQGGRAPIEQRITLEPGELLVTLVTHRVGSRAKTHDDQDTFLMPTAKDDAR